MTGNDLRNVYNHLPKYHLKAFLSRKYSRKVKQLTKTFTLKFGRLDLEYFRRDLRSMLDDTITMGKLKDLLSPRTEESSMAGARALFREFYRWYSRKFLKIDLLRSCECKDYHKYFLTMSKLVYLPELKDQSQKRKRNQGSRQNKGKNPP